jgi:hypothetical protein
VYGFHYGPGPSLFRKPTAEEVAILVSQVPSWSKPYHTGIPEIDKGLPQHPIVEDFVWLNGIPGMNTVATGIVQIIVPTSSLGTRVKEYIGSRSDIFGSTSPLVRLAEEL